MNKDQLIQILVQELDAADIIIKDLEDIVQLHGLHPSFTMRTKYRENIIAAARNALSTGDAHDQESV